MAEQSRNQSPNAPSFINLSCCCLFLLIFVFLITAAAAAPSSLLLRGNSTLLSPSRTFELGFFTVDAGSGSYYLGIWYASIPIRTYVWVANRRSPIKRPPPTATLSRKGQLALTDSAGSLIWLSDNSDPATEARLLDTGNLVLLASTGQIVWQSFDFPGDTWLPNMTVTSLRPLVSWRGPSDPSPGLYSLRLRPPHFGEFELVFNASVSYWSTGNWTGSGFAGVPEMTVPYIYSFSFSNPFSPDASFVYSETLPPPLVLSRFVVDSSGQLMQYTWSSQEASWNMFWSRPESACRVYGRCGNLGFCSEGLRPCQCPSGLHPVDADAWNSGDFAGGCALDGEYSCFGSNGSDNIQFNDIGTVSLNGGTTVSIPDVSRESCQNYCWSNCSCFGFLYDPGMKQCANLYGNAYNLQNSTASPTLYLKVSSRSRECSRNKTKNLKITLLLIGSVCGLVTILIIIGLILLLRRLGKIRYKRKAGREEEEAIAVTNLKVFSYKELSAATKGFSVKLGHGGFGAVFRGELPDSSIPVAVKRLERPGGGDREFRAEVRTIGNIQHVNLVRLYGFCSEDSHRLLVYEYMPNGSLSAYLTRNPQSQLSWRSRFQIAVGTARGIAYLHEECRDCIIHCDIKPENILLDSDYTPKVSDFGLAKLMGRDFSRVLATMRGTWGYVAPEWISGVAITAKADVYSYGMTLLEIIGGRRNVEAPAEKDEEGWFFPPWAARRIAEGDVAGVVDPGLQAGEYDAREAERAGLVAVWCIQDEEAARPSMGTVVKMLEGTVAVSTPPVPKLLQALVSGDSFPRAGVVSISRSSNNNNNNNNEDDNSNSGGGEIRQG